MVEPILLPKATARLHALIDDASRESFPGLTLLQHGIIICEGDKKVRMIGHHDKVADKITIVIKVQQTLGDDCRVLRFPERTRTVTLVKFVVPAF